MLRTDLLLCAAIVLIAIINYLGLMFYILFGLLMICAASFGPAVIFYAYTRLSPTYPIGWKYTFLSATLFLIAVLFNFDLLVYVFYGLLTVCGMLLGPTTVLYIHTLLSPKHPNGKSTKKTINKLNSFETLIMVC